MKILKPQFNIMGIIPGDNSDLIEGKNIEQIIPNSILSVLKGEEKSKYEN